MDDDRIIANFEERMVKLETKIDSLDSRLDNMEKENIKSSYVLKDLITEAVEAGNQKHYKTIERLHERLDSVMQQLHAQNGAHEERIRSLEEENERRNDQARLERLEMEKQKLEMEKKEREAKIAAEIQKKKDFRKHVIYTITGVVITIFATIIVNNLVSIMYHAMNNGG